MAGFSLVELLVVIAMISVMLAALVGLFTNLSKSYTTEEVRANAQQDLRATMDLMVRDIRMAGLNPPASGNFNFGIEDATPIKVLFTMDSEAGGSFNGAFDPNSYERITYEFNNNQLWQTQDAGTPQPVIDNVTALTFTYWDENGAQIDPVSTANDRSNIREIRVMLTVQLPAGAKGTVTRTLDTRIQCRNLWY